MDTRTIKSVVRERIENHINSLVSDLTSDNTFNGQVCQDLEDMGIELSDEDWKTVMENEFPLFDKNVINKFIDYLTDSFMNKL